MRILKKNIPIPKSFAESILTSTRSVSAIKFMLLSHSDFIVKAQKYMNDNDVETWNDVSYCMLEDGVFSIEYTYDYLKKLFNLDSAKKIHDRIIKKIHDFSLLPVSDKKDIVLFDGYERLDKSLSIDFSYKYKNILSRFDSDEYYICYDMDTIMQLKTIRGMRLYLFLCSCFPNKYKNRNDIVHKINTRRVLGLLGANLTNSKANDKLESAFYSKLISKPLKEINKVAKGNLKFSISRVGVGSGNIKIKVADDRPKELKSA